MLACLSYFVVLGKFEREKKLRVFLGVVSNMCCYSHQITFKINLLQNTYLLCTFNIVYPCLPTDGHKPIIGHIGNRQRLGPAGLALHYANIVLQIDTLVSHFVVSISFHVCSFLCRTYPEPGENIIEVLELLLLLSSSTEFLLC